MTRKSVEKVPQERGQEKAFENIARDYPKTAEYLKKGLDACKEHTSKILESSNYNEAFKNLVKEVRGLFKQRGYEMLVSPVGGKDIRSEMTFLYPAKNPVFSEESLINFWKIKKIAPDFVPDFAEEGLKMAIDRYEEFFKGNEIGKITERLLEKTEVYNEKMAEEDFVAKMTEPEGVAEFIKVKNEMTEAEESLWIQTLKQYVEKIKKELPEDKIAETLAVSETFLDSLDSGIELNMRRAKDNLINDFSGLLNEKIIDDILSKREKIMDEIKKMRWEENNESFYV